MTQFIFKFIVLFYFFIYKVNTTHVCTVSDNGANYRGCPGPEYPVLGQVNRGQNIIIVDINEIG